MPVTLTPTLTYHPTRGLRLHSDRRPAWKRVQENADAAVAAVFALWRGLFQDARRALSVRRLTRALRGHLVLDAYNEIVTAWHRTVEIPGRALLVQVATPLVQASAEATVEGTPSLARQPLSVTTRLPEVEQWIAAYVGTQIRDMTETTLRTVRTVLRDGRQAGTSPAALARELQSVVGLTPRQQRGIAQIRTRLTAQGKTPAQVIRAVHEATVRGLALRARLIAETETQAIAQFGMQEAWRQAVRGGVVDENHVRRYWVITGRNTCDECRAIPGMNAEGVGLASPFQSGFGVLMGPPAHPS